jgi:hypothetical protein
MGELVAACEGHPQNCELLVGLHQLHAQRCEEAGIWGTEAMVSAMAVGLVIEVWRNGPVEDMHASERGPDDSAMFAESAALHGKAIAALTADDRAFGLLGFEDHLLDRTRSWAGTGGRNLLDLGYGHLGEYKRHVKDRVNALIALHKHTCVDDPLQAYLVNKALWYGKGHMGMPMWPVIVERIGVLLADPAHPAWRGRGTEALAAMPEQARPAERLAASLLSAPYDLPLVVLEWLSRFLLHTAGPPYDLIWGQST